MPTTSCRARLLSATALACGTLTLSGGSARAACQPDPPNGAPVVTCDNDVNGFAAPPADDLTVDVNGNINGTIPGNPNGAAISFDGNTANKALNNRGSINGNITAIDNAGNVTIYQGGNLNGGVTITGTGTNTLTLARNANGFVSMQGTSNTVDVAATMNQGLQLTGSAFNNVVIRSGGTVNTTFRLTGGGQNSVDNYGRINGNATIDGTGTSAFINRPSAEVTETLQSVGTSEDSFLMLGGRIRSVRLGDGDDQAWINGGTLVEGIATGAGEDRLLWDGGRIDNGGIDMGDDDDVATFRGLTAEI